MIFFWFLFAVIGSFWIAFSIFISSVAAEPLAHQLQIEAVPLDVPSMQPRAGFEESSSRNETSEANETSSLYSLKELEEPTLQPSETEAAEIVNKPVVNKVKLP